MGRVFIVLCIVYGKAFHCSLHPVREGYSLFFASCMGRVFIVLCIVYGKAIHCSLHHVWEGCSLFFVSCMGRLFIVLCILYGKAIRYFLHHVWEEYSLFFTSCMGRLFIVLYLSPDVMLCGWLGSKHQLTNWLSSTAWKATKGSSSMRATWYIGEHNSNCRFSICAARLMLRFQLHHFATTYKHYFGNVALLRLAKPTWN